MYGVQVGVCPIRFAFTQFRRCDACVRRTQGFQRAECCQIIGFGGVGFVGGCGVSQGASQFLGPLLRRKVPGLNHGVSDCQNLGVPSFFKDWVLGGQRVGRVRQNSFPIVQA